MINKIFLILFISGILSIYIFVYKNGCVKINDLWYITSYYFILSIFLVVVYRFLQFMYVHGFSFFSKYSFSSLLGHLGLYIACLGMCMDKGLGIEKKVVLSVGDCFYLNGSKIIMKPLVRGVESNYFYERTPFVIYDKNKAKFKFFTEKRFFKTHQILTTEVGRLRVVLSEFYIVPGSIVGDGKRSFSVYYRSNVYMIWFGGIMIVLSLLYSSYISFRKSQL